MITLFTEDDLISFGQYMLSDIRNESIINNPEIKDEAQKESILKAVTPFDYNNWVRFRLSESQESDSMIINEEIEVPEVLDDSESKVVPMYPDAK